MVINVVPSASRKDIWIWRDGGGSFNLGSVMNTKISGLNVNLRVDNNVVRLVSPRAADGVAIFKHMLIEKRDKGKEKT